MINLNRLVNWLFLDRRPEWDKQRDREFIQAVNSLKTLRTTPDGGVSIDPEEPRAGDRVSRAAEAFRPKVLTGSSVRKD